jgi:hypothetical protein
MHRKIQAIGTALYDATDVLLGRIKTDEDVFNRIFDELAKAQTVIEEVAEELERLRDSGEQR